MNMKRIGIIAGLVVVLALGVVLLPRIQQSVAAEPAAPTQGGATAPAASGSLDSAQPFQPHSLRGMTSDQLKEYAQAYAAYTHMESVDSIPFAKIATEHEMREAGLQGLRDENNAYGWVIFKGHMAVTAPGARATLPSTVPYQILGFDLDRGEPSYTILSPDGTGLGKLVGDPSLPTPAPAPPLPDTSQYQVPGFAPGWNNPPGK